MENPINLIFPDIKFEIDLSVEDLEKILIISNDYFNIVIRDGDFFENFKYKNIKPIILVEDIIGLLCDEEYFSIDNLRLKSVKSFNNDTILIIFS